MKLTRPAWVIVAAGFAVTAVLMGRTTLELGRYSCDPAGEAWSADAFELTCGEEWRRYRRRVLQAAGAQALGGIGLSIGVALALSRRRSGTTGEG